MTERTVRVSKGLPDWYAKQWELQQAADTRRSDCFDLRNSARLIRNETQIKTEWDTYMNNARLADRQYDIFNFHRNNSVSNTIKNY